MKNDFNLLLVVDGIDNIVRNLPKQKYQEYIAMHELRMKMQARDHKK